MTLKAGRPRWWAAGLCLGVALVVVLPLSQERHQGAAGVEQSRPVAAAAALRTFATAVRERDRSHAVLAAPPGDPTAATLLTALVENARTLAVSGFTARYVDEVGTPADDGSWTARVEVTWRFEGFDPSVVRSNLLVRFAQARQGVGIVGFGSRPERSERLPLWLRGPLAVARSADILVVVDGSHARADQVLRQTQRGVDIVRRVLPRWRDAVVVEVPADAEALDEALATSPGAHVGIAAVTATVDGSGEPGATSHVFMNPDVVDALPTEGAQAVLSHELVHLATDAAASDVPAWLVEGFADYVALRDRPQPDRVMLRSAIELVRAEGAPDHLPGRSELDGDGSRLEAAYGQAWLACRIVADRVGERGLVAVHGSVAAGVPLGLALRAAGLREADLLRSWRTRLQHLAG